MRFFRKVISCIAIVLSTLSLSFFSACSNNVEYTFKLKDNGELIANKGMGWNFGYYANSLSSFGE